MNTKPYEMCWRVDEDGRPCSIAIKEENKTITLDNDGNVTYILDEIPDTYERVIIKLSDGTRLMEKLKNDLKGNQFYVDYNTGVVYFSSSLKSKIVNIEYYGRGFKRINSLRVKNIVFDGLTNEEIDTYIAELQAMKNKQNS